MSQSPLLKYRVYAVVVIHALLVGIAWFGAWYLRLDQLLFDEKASRGVDYLGRAVELFPWILAARLLCFMYFEMFQGLWRYVSLTDLVNLFKATVAGSLLFIPVLVVHGGFQYVPRLVPIVIEPMLCMLLVGGIRLAIRVFREFVAPDVRGGRRVLIAGAGDAGEMLLRELRAHVHLGYVPVGFLDDDARKLGTKIHGVPVLGRIADVRGVVERTGAEEIIVAMTAATATHYRRILEQVESTGVRLRRLPGRIRDIVRITEVRDVNVEDLLDRDAADIDIDALASAVRGKPVLVTGAGGSIGSEVVRQLAPLRPSVVVAVDRSENALFFLERELTVHHPELRLRVAVADCQERPTMRALFEDVRPAFVIHAAAYKHVPLMEAHAVEAVRNNVAVTRLLAELSIEHGAEKFLLISSDKAVRPTSVMGATKRAAELALQAIAPCATQFVAVRFGNVLGSQGSVVPLFQRQIREGGPVTVTHPDVVRYFMTIREAVGLVLQAGIMGKGGEVFHLDMGQPVRVHELAERLIQLSGFRPHEDIEIRIVGLRPGEKMHEELLAEGEDVAETDHERIRVLRKPPPDRDLLEARLQDLLSAASAGRLEVILALKALVPEYEPNNDDYRRFLAERPLREPAPRKSRP